MLISLITLLNSLILLIMILVSIAFVTLLERKILGLIQSRKGPNKVSLFGVLQPLADGVKLFCKEILWIYFSSKGVYMFMPLGMFVLMMVGWLLLPTGEGVINSYKNGVLLIVCLLSVGVYPIMLGGWFSGSLYSMLGGIRSISQMLSYEVSMIMLIMGVLVLIEDFSLFKFIELSEVLIFMFPLMVLLFLSMVMELNRTPVDLIGGESELVSGFNVEYYGVGFAFIFLGEYGMIIFMGGLFLLILAGISPYSMYGIIFICLFIYMVILFRGVLPRLRYDYLMYFCWTSILSFSLGYLILVIGVFLFI